jgi:hypothetical protein
MKQRYIKRYLKRGLFICVAIFFLVKLLFHRSLSNQLNLSKERDVHGVRVSVSKPTENHGGRINFRDEHRVVKLKSDEKGNDSLDSDLSKFVDDQEDSGPAKKPVVDKNGPGIVSVVDPEVYMVDIRVSYSCVFLCKV